MLTELTAAQLAEKLRAKEVSAVEVTEAFLDRIEAQDSKYGAFLGIDREMAIIEAAKAQLLLDSGTGGMLTGVPIAVKDNISTNGLETTCASKILAGYVPPFDATVVNKLRAAGVVILGKANMDEFAMGSSNETSCIKPARNPWDTGRTPGGSSGGSAAAVAAQMAPMALGSDTGGSIRLPASFCGIVGYKPTYGRCSRYGLIAFASSLDQIGPITRTVEDAALLAEITTGHCEMDATSLPSGSVDSSRLKEGSLKGLRLAVPKEMFGVGTDPAVRETFESAADHLRSLGAVVDEISIPSISLGVTTYYIIAPAEASSNLGRFDGVRYGHRSQGQGHINLVEKSRAEGFGHEVKARIMIGTYALSAGYYDAFYVKAQQVRAMMTAEFMDAFKAYDFILSPTSPVTAFKLGELSQDPMAMKLLDYCTIPANMGGFPSISLPCGMANGLPVGLQLMGAPSDDERMLQAAYSIEQVLFDRVPAPSLT
jgi:aspartyl-tRNA(Asn)/glutamyl-tRNA(Gln) amidotransferase subunit A